MTDTDPNPLALLFVSALIGGTIGTAGIALRLVPAIEGLVIGSAIAGLFTLTGALNAAQQGAI